MHKLWCAIAFGLCVGFLASANIVLADVGVLTWTPNAESDLAGYKVYRSTVAGQYGATPVATLGKVTTYNLDLPSLAVDTTYFVTITAYDQAGQESGRSNEVSKLVKAIPPVAPTVTLTVLGNPQTEPWGVEITTTAKEPFSTQVWLDGVLHHTESFAPRCLTEVNATCSKALYPPGTHVVEARILQNGVEVARKSVTVVVPIKDVPPNSPTGLGMK